MPQHTVGNIDDHDSVCQVVEDSLKFIEVLGKLFGLCGQPPVHRLRDEDKREGLITFLQEIRTQIFMTTTDLKMTGDLARHDCRVIEVRDGQIR